MPRYAAIDIGSNSIRLEAADVTPGSAPKILAAERQVTRLGESVFQTGLISPQAMEFTCGVLAGMASQYKPLDVVGIRAVATASVRDARNQAEFLDRASAAIGAPVEVISGREEARLIHLGVESQWPHPGKRVLIVDIGGGSMEAIASEDGHMRDAISKPLGAVRLQSLLLPSDPPTERDLHRLQEFVEQRLASVIERFGHGHWDRAIATSATASAIVCAVNSIPRSRRDNADRFRASTVQIRKLYRKLSGINLNARKKVTGIGPRRAEIIVPGVCVLLRILEDLKIPSVNYSAAGVRDGIIADLALRGVGRELAELSRDQRAEVERMSVRYAIPIKHSRKVATLARTLFHSLQGLHRLPPLYGKLLEASAYLLDIGHFVSDASHHKHSYYLINNSDLPGFTNAEREFIANLCRYHRKAMPVAGHNNYRALNAEEKRALPLLIPLLRLAYGLDRSHAQHVESIRCQLQDGQVLIQIVSEVDIDLEQWAAEGAAQVFQQVYGRALLFERASS